MNRKTKSPGPTSSDTFVCTNWQIASVCISFNDEGVCEGWTTKSVTCTSYMLVEDGDDEGGSGGTSGPGEDPCEPCEPHMPCQAEPGQGEGGTTGCQPDSGGGGDGGNPNPPTDPCEYDNPPSYCSTEPCEITSDQIAEAFPNAPEDRLNEITGYFNEYADDFDIDTDREMQHFLSQAGHESTPPGTSTTFGTFEENLNYQVDKLGVAYKKRYFNPPSNPNADPEKENPFDYEQYSGSKYVDHEKFANYVYDDANRSEKHKLGNTAPGDGYKYRGRGIFQLTGKDNYETFNEFYTQNYDNGVDLINDPNELMNNTKIAVISALWYFKKEVLNDSGELEEDNIVKITRAINGRKKGLPHRKQLFENANDKINCL